LKRIKKLFDYKPEIFTSPDAIEGKEIAGKIEFKNLNFSYNGNDNPVLEEISLKIDVGQKVAIVGHTGSGKSTLVSLLPRLYPVPDGHIFIDGIDINKYKLETLRSSIGFIPQDGFLFSDNISENIAFGSNSNVNSEDVLKAAKTADFYKDVDTFPDKFETMIGERGITLSGGQKQRISIARAIYRRPPILIFDDAFSSVDTSTEEHILQNLEDVIKDTTVLLISHRISTVKNADVIIVLQDGKIVESGNHNDLIEQDGVYAEIHRKQLLKEELETI
jgi:ATP-binding cassette subfamily B multidrug efflux pump